MILMWTRKVSMAVPRLGALPTQTGNSKIAVGKRSRSKLIPQFFEFSRELVEFDAPPELDR